MAKKGNFAADFKSFKTNNNLNKMAGNRTFTMIKPDAVAAGNTGAITKMIEEAGFRIVAMKKTHLSAALAGKFYEIHKERPFYGELCAYMSSGAIVPMILEKENAVEDFQGMRRVGIDAPPDVLVGRIEPVGKKEVRLACDIPVESNVVPMAGHSICRTSGAVDCA